ncbi:CGL149 [Auxenochlorella protothecoides x Auxenochlorella symbiontica]
MAGRLRPSLLVAALSLLVLLTPSTKAFDIEGRVILPGIACAHLRICSGCRSLSYITPSLAHPCTPTETTPNALDTELVLSKEQGDEVRTFPLPDGRFAFHNVPAGKHYLEVELVGLVYSTVELTVGVAGDVNALLSDVINRPAVPYPLVLRPMGRLEFFQKPQPFNVMAFIKTPYGIMIIFGIFSLVVMPRLRAYSEELNSEETAEESTVPPPTVTAVASPRQLQQRRKDR